MGRGKTSLNRIQDEKARKKISMNRNKNLMKKISEVSTLCNVEACLIVYDGDGDIKAPPMTWPKDTRVVKSMLEKYELQKHEKPPNTFDVKDYLSNRKFMILNEICKVKKEILNIKHPTTDPCFNNTGKDQLMNFIAMIDAKIGACSERINLLKNKEESEDCFSFMQNMAQESFATSSVSYPNHFSFMQNIPHMMIMQPHNQVGDNFDSRNQLVEPMNFSDLLFLSSPRDGFLSNFGRFGNN